MYYVVLACLAIALVSTRRQQCKRERVLKLQRIVTLTYLMMEDPADEDYHENSIGRFESINSSRDPRPRKRRRRTQETDYQEPRNSIRCN